MCVMIDEGRGRKSTILKQSQHESDEEKNLSLSLSRTTNDIQREKRFSTLESLSLVSAMTSNLSREDNEESN